MAGEQGSHEDSVSVVPNRGWDQRLILCRCDTIADAYVIVTQRSVIVIDTLINPITAWALLGIAQVHFTGDRTLLVVNTHADYDHCWGNQIFAGSAPLHPAPISPVVRPRHSFALQRQPRISQR